MRSKWKRKSGHKCKRADETTERDEGVIRESNEGYAERKSGIMDRVMEEVKGNR